MANEIVLKINGKEIKRLSFSPGQYTMGRGQNADISIASEQVSRIHAKLIVDHQHVKIIDHSSSNGTAVNGQFVSSTYLQSGDSILLGDTSIFIEIPSIEKPKSLSKNTPKNVNYIAATKVIADRLRPKSLWPMFSVAFALIFTIFILTLNAFYQNMLNLNLRSETLQRGQNLVRLLAEKNKVELNLKNELLLDLDSILKEQGVKEAFIMDENAKILAPMAFRNHMDSSDQVTEALKSRSFEKREHQLNENDDYVFVHPIRIYNPELGQYQTIGVAKIIFSSVQNIHSSSLQFTTFGFLIIALALAIFLGWFFSKNLSLPLQHLANKIHLWRQGQKVQNETAPFKEWSHLYEAVDLTIEDSKQ